MAKSRKISVLLGSSALVMALLAFVLGSAPFTPALLLVVIAVPLALIAGFFGAWRLAITTLYYSCAAWLMVPMARLLSIRIDYLIAVLGVVGLCVAASLLYGYLVQNRVR